MMHPHRDRGPQRGIFTQTNQLFVCISHGECGKRLTWFEVQRRERLRVEEVEGGTHCEQHVVVVPFIQDDEDQIAHLETGAHKHTQRKKRLTMR